LLTKRLLIDTSSEYGILAISEESSLLAQRVFFHENGLARSLLAEITTLLQKTGHTLRDLTEIGVGVGPGSYTGTRVGVATARALSFALEIPLRGFCSLIAFLPDRLGHFGCILGAKSGLFYLLQGTKSIGNISIYGASLMTKEELYQAVSSVDFIVAKQGEELAQTDKEHAIFDPDPQNIAWALNAPATFSFEKEAQLIYLHP